MKVHREVKPIRCSECAQSFTKTSSLKKHMRVHSGGNCNPCTEDIFCTSTSFSQIKAETGDTPHGCLECTESFSTLDLLKEHSKIHSNEKPYNCTECFKSFPSSSALEIHFRIHTVPNHSPCLPL